MAHTRTAAASTATWIRFSSRTGRVEMNTALACAQLAEAARAGFDVVVEGDRRLVVERAGYGDRVTFTPAHVGDAPAAWQWGVLERLAGFGGLAAEYDRGGRIRLLAGGRLLDRAASAVAVDRGWVEAVDGRAALTWIGRRMLDHHRGSRDGRTRSLATPVGAGAGVSR
ncbi:hypothetical protein GCM10009830_30100 [Glycomyces endophyticus]|uniref:Uncharacterized protein n=1 Tax=Glycomyces endophyticus TaxID=480996 RepID=A0ABP4T1X2_9ACTN